MRRYYDHVWQAYNAKLPAELTPFERDVQIAYQVLQQSGLADAEGAICRSPQTQLYVGSRTQTDINAYILQVCGAAQERSLSDGQLQLGKRVKNVLSEVLDYLEEEKFDGQHYHLQWKPETKELIWTAKDGRGIIFRSKQGYIAEVSLLQQDLEPLKQARHTLTQAHQVQKTSQHEPRQKPRKRQKERRDVGPQL